MKFILRTQNNICNAMNCGLDDIVEIQMAKKAAVKEVTLETILWNCRVALRGIGSTEKNRDAVIGLVFLNQTTGRFQISS